MTKKAKPKTKKAKPKCVACGSESLVESTFLDSMSIDGKGTTEKEIKCNACGNRRTV